MAGQRRDGSGRYKPAGQRARLHVSQQLALDPGDNIIEVVAYNASNLLASLPARTMIKSLAPQMREADASCARHRHQRVYGSRLEAAGLRSDLGISRRLKLGGEGCNCPGGQPEAGGQRAIRRSEGDGSARSDATATVSTASSSAWPARSTRATPSCCLPPRTASRYNGRFYLIPQDYDGGTNPARLPERAIGQDRLQDWLANRIKAKKTILLLDTCEVGRARRWLHTLAHRRAGLRGRDRSPA